MIEPLRLVEQYGADAVRFTLSSMAVPGTDIPFSEDRMKGYRAFANKVWQASNFVLMNLKENGQAVPPDSIDALLAKGKERWPEPESTEVLRLLRVGREARA